jgi:hypothetical protein
MQVPKFELGSTNLSPEQFKEALDSAKSGGKGFQPGNYRLKITDAQYHVNKETGSINSKADPSWINVSLNLIGADGRSKKHFLSVPTKDIWFNGKDGKKTIFPFSKLQQFMAALGVYLDNANYANVIKSYFSPEGLAQLNGGEVTVDIGFTGPYVKYVDKGRYQIVINEEVLKDADGKEVEFADSDSAKAYGATVLLKNLQTFPEITKFYSAPEKKAEQKAGNDGW